MMASLDFSVLGMIFLFFNSNNSVIRASFLLFVCIPPPPYWLSGKEPACQCRRHKRDRFDPWIGKIPWRRAWQPLQYSCLENPTDRGAWRARVHGISTPTLSCFQMKKKKRKKLQHFHFFYKNAWDFNKIEIKFPSERNLTLIFSGLVK